MISIFLIVLLSSCISTSFAICPNIISRNEWGARAPSGFIETLPPTVNYSVIHHSAGASCTTKESCISQVKGFQTLHMDTNEWSDIGYNFVVGEDGLIYEGRGWAKKGAHAPQYNSDSIGICIIGTFTSRKPNDAALNAVKSLIKCGVEIGRINSEYKLRGHRDGRVTECPGQQLYEEIKTWPHYVY